MPIREAGQVLGGKYRLVARLGGGGMGSVWRAEHLALSSPVAIKLIEPATAREPDALHRFLREARTAAALRSPHVVQIFDYGVDGDTPYIVMELLEGESLAERLAHRVRLSPAETARVIQHIARALVRAHEAGIVHRDLKPENVFLVKNDDDELAKVLDFGIVKTDPNAFDTQNPGAATRTGTLLGTPYFMSPEQAESSKSVDHRADIWALGVLAYRCLLGELPFTGDSVGRLILEICSRPLPVPSQRGPVPAGFDAWFARVCARDPRARFESARRAAAELSALTEGPATLETAPASPPPAPVNPIALRTTTLESSNTEVLAASRRPRRLTLALAACAVLSLGAVIAVRSWSLSRARPTPPSAALEQRREALEASFLPRASPLNALEPAREHVLERANRGVFGRAATNETAPGPPATRTAAATDAPAEPTPSVTPSRAAATPSAPAPTPTLAPAPPRAPATAGAAVARAAPTAPARAQLTKPPERKPPALPRPKVDLGI